MCVSEGGLPEHCTSQLLEQRFTAAPALGSRSLVRGPGLNVTSFADPSKVSKGRRSSRSTYTANCRCLYQLHFTVSSRDRFGNSGGHPNDTLDVTVSFGDGRIAPGPVVVTPIAGDYLVDYRYPCSLAVQITLLTRVHTITLRCVPIVAKQFVPPPPQHGPAAAPPPRSIRP